MKKNYEWLSYIIGFAAISIAVWSYLNISNKKEEVEKFKEEIAEENRQIGLKIYDMTHSFITEYTNKGMFGDNELLLAQIESIDLSKSYFMDRLDTVLSTLTSITENLKEFSEIPRKN